MSENTQYGRYKAAIDQALKEPTPSPAPGPPRSGQELGEGILVNGMTDRLQGTRGTNIPEAEARGISAAIGKFVHRGTQYMQEKAVTPPEQRQELAEKVEPELLSLRAELVLEADKVATKYLTPPRLGIPTSDTLRAEARDDIKTLFNFATSGQEAIEALEEAIEYGSDAVNYVLAETNLPETLLRSKGHHEYVPVWKQKAEKLKWLTAGHLNGEPVGAKAAARLRNLDQLSLALLTNWKDRK
jgi:hypothetical protein